MGTISVSLPSDGTSIDAADVNTPFNTIVNELNGNIDNANIKSAAAISGSKLADASLDIGLKGSVWDGWIAVADSWTYASATTITVPTDATTKYSVGDKIKLVQSGSTKYFYITGVAATTLTVNGGTDYTVANAAISGVYYSKVVSPLSFPQYFAWTPTITSGSGTFTATSASGRFSMNGKSVHFKTDVTITTVGTASGAVLFTLPVTAQTTTGNIGSGREDVVSGKMISAKLNTSATTASSSNYDNTSWIAATSVGRISGTYEAA